MLKLRVIPCLDVKDGRVVKGVNFVGLRDAGDPVEQAALYDAAGADELTFLDITASHENRDTIVDVVGRTAEKIFLPLTVGGGIRETEDMRRLLLAGADKCSINSAAVARPELIGEAARKFGSQCVVVAIDARQSGPGKWEVCTHGGRGNSADEHGPRWHRGRIRPGFAGRGVRRGAAAGGGFGGCRDAGSFRRRRACGGNGPAGGKCFSFRDVHGAAGQAGDGRRWPAGSFAGGRVTRLRHVIG